MYLGNKVLPLKLPSREALSLVKKFLLEKYWENYEIGAAKLVLIPYFFYNFHYFLEKEAKVEKTVDGKLVLNANTLKIESDVLDLILDNIKEITNSSIEEEFIEKEVMVEKAELNGVLKIKTAEFFKIPKENIHLSKPTTILIPYYNFDITLNKKKYTLIINCVNKKIENGSVIPLREKGVLEVTNETLNDLTKPKNWIKYSKELLLEFKDSSKDGVLKVKKEVLKKENNEFNLDFLSSKWILILIIILALFLIFISIIY